MRRVGGVAVALVLVAVFSVSARGEPEPIDLLPVVELEAALHFTAADGGRVELPSGAYRVSAEGSRLLLESLDGRRYYVDGATGRHEESVALPTAVRVPGDEPGHVWIALLRADGVRVAALGTEDGVRTRGGGTFGNLRLANAVRELAASGKVAPQETPSVVHAPLAATASQTPAPSPVTRTILLHAGRLQSGRDAYLNLRRFDVFPQMPAARSTVNEGYGRHCYAPVPSFANQYDVSSVSALFQAAAGTTYVVKFFLDLTEPMSFELRSNAGGRHVARVTGTGRREVALPVTASRAGQLTVSLTPWTGGQAPTTGLCYGLAAVHIVPANPG